MGTNLSYLKIAKTVSSFVKLAMCFPFKLLLFNMNNDETNKGFLTLAISIS